MSTASQELAVAIRNVSRRQAQRVGRAIARSQVVRVSPLQVEMLDHELTLDIDDDFDVSGSLAFLIDNGGVELGDVILLFEDSGTFTAFDIVPTDDRAIPAALSSRVINAKGDLIVGQADDIADRLAVGTDGQMLTADAAAARGMKWTTPAMVKIGDFASVGSGRLRFSSIPQTFTHLRIVAAMHAQTAGVTNAFLQMNGILAGNNYSWWYKAVSQAGGDETGGTLNNYCYLGGCPGLNRANDGFLGTYVVDIPFYSATDIIKSFLSHSASATGPVASPDYRMVAVSGMCISTVNAITTIDIGEVTGTGLGPKARATLYGVL